MKIVKDELMWKLSDGIFCICKKASERKSVVAYGRFRFFKQLLSIMDGLDKD